jgi:uncharacterized membrane protein HdeD (DUF308 family)
VTIVESQSHPGVPRFGLQELRRSWGLFLGLGVLLELLGIIGILATWLYTLASVIFIGWLLIASGVIHLIQTFRTRGWEGRSLHLLLGILQGAVGVLLLLHPLAGAASLTLMLAALFIVGGLFRIFAAISARFHSWGWQVLNGLITFVLGVIIAAGWPATSLWTIGLFVGVDLVFAGVTFIMLAMEVQRLPVTGGTPRPGTAGAAATT